MAKRIYDKTYWWQSKKDYYARVMATIDALREQHSAREKEHLLNMRLYGNVYTRDLSLQGYAKPQSHRRHHRVQMNICQAMVDTICAKVTSQQTKVQFLTEGGDFVSQQKAKRLTKFCSGLFNMSNLYRVAPLIFRDAAVLGMGVMKIFQRDGKVLVERVFPNEIIIDDAESISGEPRQYFQRKFIPVEILKGMFPNKAKEIENAERVDSGDPGVSAMVECIEAWHLPSSEGADDGRHCLLIDGVDLFVESYERTRPPFVFLRWTPRMLGFFAEGLCSQLTGLQVELNHLCRQISLNMRLATPKCFIESGSQISSGTISNETWGICEYTGTPPSFFVPQTTAPEVLQHLDRIFARAYEIAGISSLESQAKKPAGLESGVALREYATQASTRYAAIQRAYESMFLEAADHMLELVRAAADDGEDLDVMSIGEKDLQRIKWSDIKLDREDYVIRKWPTNLFSDSPASKLQSVTELAQSGLIDPAQAMLLLDYPDTEALTHLLTSDYHDVMHIISQMLEHGKFIPPEPFQNLQLATKLVNSAYLRAKTQGAPEDRLDLLRRYLENAAALLAEAMQPMGGAPGDMPMQQSAPSAASGGLPQMDPMQDVAALPPPVQ
mgnify:FL=1|tara:strand:+ start:11437 stop:13272 length:1836 start_codon:yes stop_codon:yes gene_type:complete